MEPGGTGEPGGIEVRVDGFSVEVPAGATLLDACDRAGAYVPRLCAYPGLAAGARSAWGGDQCGLCLVRLGDGTIALACATLAASGLEVSTGDAELGALRVERLATILASHPHVCLTCPDRDGCARDECTYGNPPAARCCSEIGRCELGKVAAFVDPGAKLRRTAVSVSREALVEGRIRREPGLCIRCGRCVAVCETLPEAGRALEMAPLVRPKCATLRESGCTFCGQCVLVCPAGALTAPGEDGARWLAGRRARGGLAAPVLPPGSRVALSPKGLEAVPREAGVFQLVDAEGRVLRIGGVADLRQGLTLALEEPVCGPAASFWIELDPLYTQRETELLARFAHEQGRLPPGNDLGEDLFADGADGADRDDLFGSDPEDAGLF